MTELKKDNMVRANTFLMIGIIFLSGIVFYQGHKIETEKVNIVATANEYELKIEKLSQEMIKLESELEENKELFEKVKGISRYLEEDNISPKEIEKANKISEETPLDFETSMILVMYSQKYELRPSLLLSVMENESNFQQYLVGTHRDRGLMQIIPATEKWLAKDFGSAVGMKYDPQNIFDPEYNIGLATMYLSHLKEAYGNNYDRILSEYNRGPYKLKVHYQKNGTYATSYSKRIIRGESKYIAFNE